MAFKDQKNNVSSLQKLCLDSFLLCRKKEHEFVIDDVSTDEKIIALKIPVKEDVDWHMFFSTKHRRGMQREKPLPANPFKSREEMQRSLRSVRLSTIHPIYDMQVLKVALENARTIYQFLRIVDRTVITPEIKETCRSLFLRSLAQSSILRNVTTYCPEPVRSIPVDDAVLFVVTTPRALLFIKKKEPDKLYICYFDGTFFTHKIPNLFFHNVSVPWRAVWTEDGRFVSLFNLSSLVDPNVVDPDEDDSDKVVFSFDLLMRRSRNNDHFLAGPSRYTMKPVRFIYRDDIVDANPTFTVYDPKLYTHAYYCLMNTYVRRFDLFFCEPVLREHQKFREIIGIP
jgi:hypothetical protein